jgi:hypothetical protein
VTPEVVPASEAQRAEVPAQAPPSTYAVADFLDGAEGSLMRLAGLTALRSVFIAPGLWVASKIAGVPLTFGQTVGFSVASSTTITAGMVGWYALRRRALRPRSA